MPNPSQLFLAERPAERAGLGGAVLRSKARGRCSSRCRRSSAPARYGNARRMASGIDQQRLSLLLAVLEKRAGLNLIGDDVFVNIAGGMTVDEPAADLGVARGDRVERAQPRRFRRRPRCSARSAWPARSAAITQAALRVREAAQMGFTPLRHAGGNIDPADAHGPTAAASWSASGRSARRSTQLIA